MYTILGQGQFDKVLILPSTHGLHTVLTNDNKQDLADLAFWRLF